MLVVTAACTIHTRPLASATNDNGLFVPKLVVIKYDKPVSKTELLVPKEEKQSSFKYVAILKCNQVHQHVLSLLYKLHK